MAYEGAGARETYHSRNDEQQQSSNADAVASGTNQVGGPELREQMSLNLRGGHAETRTSKRGTYQLQQRLVCFRRAQEPKAWHKQRQDGHQRTKCIL